MSFQGDFKGANKPGSTLQCDYLAVTHSFWCQNGCYSLMMTRTRKSRSLAEEDLSIQRRLWEVLGVCRLCAPSFALLLLLLLALFALVLGQLQQAL